MPVVHDEHKSLLEEVEIILQFLSHPQHLNEPDGEHIRAILCDRALDKVRAILNRE